MFKPTIALFWCHIRVVTQLENLEKSGNLTLVREIRKFGEIVVCL